MPRRREFRGVAAGLLGAFLGRNNDVNGYWGLGKLYKHARASATREVRVDLVGSVLTPPGPEFSDMVELFRNKLTNQLAAHTLPNEWLKGAEVSVTFSGKKDACRPGDIFYCLTTLTDDLGHVHQARRSGACWIHDPAKELKRGTL